MGDAVVAGDEAPDGIHLVLHQGDEGGNHDRGPLHDKGGKLVTERFPAARGHQDKGVASSDEMPDDAFLVPLEGVETEELLETGVDLLGIDVHAPRVYCSNVDCSNLGKLCRFSKFSGPISAKKQFGHKNHGNLKENCDICKLFGNSGQTVIF